MSELGILVVEDDAIIREVMCETLADADFHVMGADNATHAWEVLDSEVEIDAAFIDIDLGDRANGYDVARHALETRPNMLVVFTSGGAREDHERQRSPGSLFMPKPYSPNQVAHMLRATLQKHG